MTVFRWNSLQDLFAIQEKVNRLFEETIHRTEFPDDGLDAALWSPAADVYETPEEIILQHRAARRPSRRRAPRGPGRQAARLGAAHVEGVEPRHFVRMERIYGSFSRDFPVPASLDPDAIKASLRAGVLRVVAPKSEKGQAIPVEPRKDAVKPGSKGRRGVFRIGVIAERFGIHPQTLRMYEREGLLRPARTEGNTRLYDADTIERLEIILTLTRHLGVNLAGVEVILHMKQRMEKHAGRRPEHAGGPARRGRVRRPGPGGGEPSRSPRSRAGATPRPAAPTGAAAGWQRRTERQVRFVPTSCLLSPVS